MWATSAHQTLPTRHGRSAVTSRSDTPDFTNTAWAFALAGQSDAWLSEGVLPEAAERLVGNFGSQDFTNTAWAFAVASQSEAWLFRWARLESAERWVGDFSTPDFTITAEKFPEAGHSDASLFRSSAGFSRAACERLQLTRLHEYLGCRLFEALPEWLLLAAGILQTEEMSHHLGGLDFADTAWASGGGEPVGCGAVRGLCRNQQSGG